MIFFDGDEKVFFLLILIGCAAYYPKKWYNLLAYYQVEVNQYMSDIQVLLRRQAQLVTSLIAIVKQYAVYEPKLLEEITRLRSGAGLDSKVDANEESIGSLFRSIRVMVENYPKLTAIKEFENLGRAIEDSENKVAAKREQCNNSIAWYNIYFTQVPSKFLAGICGFKEIPFLEGNTTYEMPTIDLIDKPTP